MSKAAQLDWNLVMKAPLSIQDYSYAHAAVYNFWSGVDCYHREEEIFWELMSRLPAAVKLHTRARCIHWLYNQSPIADATNNDVLAQVISYIPVVDVPCLFQLCQSCAPPVSLIREKVIRQYCHLFSRIEPSMVTIISTTPLRKYSWFFSLMLTNNVSTLAECLSLACNFPLE